MAMCRGPSVSLDGDDEEAGLDKETLKRGHAQVQRKTYTRWCNYVLGPARVQIEDLFSDIGDGRTLMKLIEIVTRERVGRPNTGNRRIHKIDNVNLCLQYLTPKLSLRRVQAEDVVDGNPDVILELIWNIILRFHVRDAIMRIQELGSGTTRPPKDVLLVWCQQQTRSYVGVKVDNFSTSWRDGLAFNALIDAHRPEIINFYQLNPTDRINNLNNAFHIAEQRLAIPHLLDAQDIDVPRPDERSIVIYVAFYFMCFTATTSETKDSPDTRTLDKVVTGCLNAKL